MGILLITHDLNLVKHFAQRVAVLNQGNLMEAGPTKQVFDHPTDAYTRALVNSEPSRDIAPVMPLSPVLLKTEDLSVAYPSTQSSWFQKPLPHKVLRKVSFSLKQGQTIGIIGESGSGKTTLGMAVLGLLGDSAAQVTGDVDVLGNDWQTLKPVERRGMRSSLQVIFQDPFGSLSPRMNVMQIVSEGLDIHFPKLSNAERETRVVDMLREVGIERSALSRYPHEFSGGQRQRIALARALAVEPQVLLLDEPFGALDAKVRKELRRWLRRLHDELHVSSVFVTHDQEEALEVSDRVVLMNRGRIEQVGTPQAVWEQPASPFVFSFLGQVNRLQGHIEDGSLRIGNGRARIACPELQQSAPQQAGYAFVRPYELEIRPATGVADTSDWIAGQVLRVLAAGPLVRLEITLQDTSILPQGEVLEVHMGLQEYAATPLRDADPVLVRPRAGRVFLV